MENICRKSVDRGYRRRLSIPNPRKNSRENHHMLICDLDSCPEKCVIDVPVIRTMLPRQIPDKNINPAEKE